MRPTPGLRRHAAFALLATVAVSVPSGDPLLAQARSPLGHTAPVFTPPVANGSGAPVVAAMAPDASGVAGGANAEAAVALRRRASASPGVTAGWSNAPQNPAPWWAPAASAILPGAGQFALRQQRSVAYLVAEAFLVVQYVAARRDGNREREAYRALALDVARKPFGGTSLGSWDYYERLEQFLESGAYDVVPGGALQPETDPTTYNGFRWLLARETFWRNPNETPAVTSPEYQRALEFYQRNAVGDEFRWSWRDAQLQQDVYIQTIRSANRSYQRAVNMLGVVAVNHLVSLVDAYVSVRVRRYGGVRVAGYTMDGVHVGYVPAANGGTALQTGVRFAR